MEIVLYLAAVSAVALRLAARLTRPQSATFLTSGAPTTASPTAIGAAGLAYTVTRAPGDTQVLLTRPLGTGATGAATTVISTLLTQAVALTGDLALAILVAGLSLGTLAAQASASIITAELANAIRGAALLTHTGP